MEVDNDSFLNNTAGNESSDGEYEELTAQQVMQHLEQAWSNEKLSPDILPHKFEMVECMLTQLHHMERNLLKLPKGDLRIMLHQLEIDRIKYIVTNYAKIRLKKIETFATYLITLESLDILTPDEQAFLRNYNGSLEKLFKSNVLDHLNTYTRRTNWSEMRVEPDINAKVFIQVNENAQSVQFGPEEVVDLIKDDRYFVSYKYVKNLILSNAVKLV